MDRASYESLASEWGQLVPMTLNVKVDGPLKRRMEDLTAEISKAFPNLPPVVWGIVLFAGFMQLRTFTRSEKSFLRGVQKLLADSLRTAASEPLV